MSLDLFKDIIPSISKKSGNLVRPEGEIDKQRQKEIEKNSFMIKRFFSYSPDCLFFVAEIDACWQKKFNLQPGMVYEFLYHSLPQGYKQIKWTKPKKTESAVDLITTALSCSDKKAKEILMFLTPEDIKQLEENGRM